MKMEIEKKDIEILKALYFGNHLNNNELERAVKIIYLLNLGYFLILLLIRLVLLKKIHYFNKIDLLIYLLIFVYGILMGVFWVLDIKIK